MRVEDFSGKWTIDERLELIAYVSAYSRYMAMRGVAPSKLPNMEVVMVIAVSSSDSLNESLPGFAKMFEVIEKLQIKPKTLEECKEEFQKLQVEYVTRMAVRRSD